MIQEEWHLLIDIGDQETHDHGGISRSIVLSGAFSPRLRLAQSATGDTIAKILDDALEVPKHIDRKLVRHLWQIIESDECPQT